MPFQPGQSGNPQGDSRTQRLFRDALMRACKQEDFKRLRGAAEKLLTLAEEGEPWAIKELADRVDGKPAQAIVGEPDQPLIHKIERVIIDRSASRDP